MKLQLRYLATCVAVALPAQALGQTLENIVVTGSYSEIAQQQMSASAQIIERDTLLSFSSSSLVDALRQVPGLWVESQGGAGGLSSIILRGAESNHTLVLVDGVQMNDPSNSRGGSFDLSHVNIQSVKRIEIIRGAQSAIYGSDALAGVIHIITTQPESGTSLKAFAALGNDDYYSYGAAVAGNNGDLGYMLKAQKKDGGQALPGSTAHNTDLQGKLNWQHQQHRLALSFRHFDGNKTSYPEQSGGPQFALSDELDSSDFTDQQAALEWAWQISPLWLSTLSSSWFNREDNSQSPGIVPYDAVPANGAKTDFTRTATRWVNTIGEQQQLWANLGIEHKQEQGDSDGYLNIGFMLPTNFSLERQINSAFVNLNGLVTDDLLLQASVRYDDPDEFASDTSVQMGLRYQLNEQLSLRLNRGEGFKLPSFFALGHPLVGNPELQAETSVTLDAGIEWQSPQLQAALNLFDNEFRDLIDFDAELFTNVNRAKVNIKGADGHISWQSADQQWQVQGQFSYQHIDSESRLNGRPQLSLGSSLRYEQNQQLSYQLQALWVDKRYASSLHTGQSLQQALDSYLRVDASVRYAYSNAWQMHFELSNLGDSDYQNDIGFAADGRGFMLSVNYQYAASDS